MIRKLDGFGWLLMACLWPISNMQAVAIDLIEGPQKPDITGFKKCIIGLIINFRQSVGYVQHL